MYKSMCMCMTVCMCMSLYICMCVYMCMSVCMCTSVCICVLLFVGRGSLVRDDRVSSPSPAVSKLNPTKSADDRSI